MSGFAGETGPFFDDEAFRLDLLEALVAEFGPMRERAPHPVLAAGFPYGSARGRYSARMEKERSRHNTGARADFSVHERQAEAQRFARRAAVDRARRAAGRRYGLSGNPSNGTTIRYVYTETGATEFEVVRAEGTPGETILAVHAWFTDALHDQHRIATAAT